MMMMMGGVKWLECLTLALGVILAASAFGTRAEDLNGVDHPQGRQSGTNRSQEGAACEYGDRWYGVGAAVPTQEPCLVCTCTVGASLVCHLRVCPAVTTSVPKGCYKLKKAGRCCPEVVCDGELESNRLYRKEGESGVAAAAVAAEVRRQQEEVSQAAVEKNTVTAEQAVLGTRRRGGEANPTPGIISVRGCVSDGAVFADGSAMISPDECSYCFCIRGVRRCVAPKCVLPLQGCRPRYRAFTCCPTNYDCHDGTTTTTPIPPKTCEYEGEKYDDGSRVYAAETGNSTCQSCFCLRGHVTCTNHTCEAPEDMEGCTPVMQEGSCCPVSYRCDDEESLVLKDRKGRSASGFDEVNPAIPQEEDIFVTEDPTFEDTTGESLTEQPETISTRKPPPKLRPMSRPSFSEIAKRRQESRFGNRENNSPRRVVQRPRPQTARPVATTPDDGLSLFERLRKRSKYTKTTQDLSYTTLSDFVVSQVPPTSAPLTPRDTQPIATTPKPRRPITKPRRPTSRPVRAGIHRFTSPTTNSVTPTTITTTTTTNIFSSIPTTKKPRTTSKSDETTQQNPTTRKESKNNAFRYSKFRYRGTTATTTTRPAITTRSSPQLTFTSPTTDEVITTLWPLDDARHEVTGVGHVGEAFLIQDRKRLTPFVPHHTPSTPTWVKPVEVATGVNVKGNLNDATAFGPILIFDNRVRTDRQQKNKNVTDANTEEEGATAPTDPSTEETTILPEVGDSEVGTPDSVAVPSSIPKESDNMEEEELTTMLSPFEPTDTTVGPQALSTKTTLSTTPTTTAELLEFLLAARERTQKPLVAEEPVDIEYLDLDTALPTYDITVGSSVLTTGHVQHSPVGVGQVIPVQLQPEDLMPHPGLSKPTLITNEPKVTDAEGVNTATESVETHRTTETGTETTPEQTITPETGSTQEPAHREVEKEEGLKMEHKGTNEGEILEAEHKTPEIETASEAPRPSLLGALFNILTQTERPNRPRPNWPRPDRPRPDFSRPDRPRPEISRPDRPRPEISRPDRPEPNVPRPDRPEPDVPRPDISRPDRPRPELPRPELARPERPRPELARPELARPERPRPERPSTPKPRPDRTRTESSRPERRPAQPRLPFRPRPRPNGGRPEFIPPRFRFTPPPPPSSPSTEEEVTTSSPPSTTQTEEPQEVPASTSRLPPKFAPPQPETPAPTPFLPPFLQPNLEEPQPSSPNSQPIPIFNLPDPIHTERPRPFVPPRSQPALAPQPSPSTPFVPPRPQPALAPQPSPSTPFVPPRPQPALAPKPAPNDNQNLPSRPVLESGFQGMHNDGEGVQPNLDFHEEYADGELPTLPPSLPNLKIIPFVAADALTGIDMPFSEEDPRSSTRPPPILPVLTPTEDQGDTADNRQPEESTESAPITTTTTTTLLTTPRRTLSRRPPILPPRRTPVRPSSDDDSTRRPFLPFGRPTERPTLPTFKPQPTTTTTTTTTTTPPPFTFEIKPTISARPDLFENKPTISARPDLLHEFSLRDRPTTRQPFIPHHHLHPASTPRPTEPSTNHPQPQHFPHPHPQPHFPRPQPTPTFRPKPTTINIPIQTPRPIVSNDISNLLLQDVFGLSDGQNSPPVRFTTGQGTPKPYKPSKVVLPEIPAAVRDQLPLATDPVLASGLLKLSGCNIYGRMYIVKDRIPELSGKCKECRCTPVGVQCLPIC